MAGPIEKLGYALLLSVPPGIGVTGFVATRTARGNLTPGALGAGVLTALLIFLVVVLIAFTGPEEPRATDPDESRATDPDGEGDTRESDRRETDGPDGEREETVIHR